MDNEDVGGADEPIPLRLTYFMIMKGIQRMIMIKVGSPTGVPAQPAQADSRLQAPNERITRTVKEGSIST